MTKLFLHRHPDFETICNVAREENKAIVQIAEKDYWIMHVLWGLTQCGFDFELKGGTSLSKGWGLINRFSEDVDIHIHPPEDMKVYSDKNHDKKKHRDSRDNFFNWLADNIQVPDIVSVERDPAWDDQKTRNCGIKLTYESRFASDAAIKPFVLLEVGFAQVEPNEPITISSWVSEIAARGALDIVDNQAAGIKCYFPEYTFVEKLSAISKKYLQEQKEKILPRNFIRHYHDVYKLLGDERIQQFIGTPEYFSHKASRFSESAQGSLSNDEAFLLSDPEVSNRYEQEYNLKASLYYRDRPSFSEILDRIGQNLSRL